MKEQPIDIPFLPMNTVTKVIIDGRAPLKLSKKLKEMNIATIFTPVCQDLYPAISGHPDILLHPVDATRILLAPNIYFYMRDELRSLGLNPLMGETILKRNYPENIAYNVARISSYAIHNFKYTDKVLLRLLEEQEIELIHVKQGYSKCAVCVVNEDAIITADRGIAKEVEKYGIEALVISQGYICLPQLDYGFIGGCTGRLGKNQLAFTGDLSHHPDEKRILRFLENHHMVPVFLRHEMLLDLGSMIPIAEMPY